MNTNLSIPEQFLILAHHPEKSGFVGSGMSDEYVIYGLVGAILLDLSRHEAIRTENKVLIPTGKKPLLYDTANQVLEKITQSKKNRKVRYWMRKLDSTAARYKKQALTHLHDQGMMRVEEKKFLGLIPYRKSYLLNHSYRIKNIEHLREVLYSPKQARPEDAILLGLIGACSISKILARDKKERKMLRKKLKNFIRDNDIAGAVGETLREMQAAVMASISASVAATTASAGN